MRGWNEELQSELDYLLEKDFDYLEAVENADMYRIMNGITPMYNIDKLIIAKAVYEIGNFEGAVEVIEMFIQGEYETIEECIVWAQRFD